MRINISIPDELKTRMDAVDERVNWSAVAREAFMREIGAPSLGSNSTPLRDWFAGLVLPEFASEYGKELAAQYAYEYADAMIAERGEHK
jgi:hypothetical protein